MNKEEKIRWLKRYKRAYERIIDLEYQLHSDRELSALILSETHTMNNTNALDDVLIRRENLKEEYGIAYKEMLKIRRDIEGALASIEDSNVARVLYLRYIELREWIDIADRMNYSEASIYRLHSIGLNTLEFDDSK